MSFVFLDAEDSPVPANRLRKLKAQKQDCSRGHCQANLHWSCEWINGHRAGLRKKTGPTFLYAGRREPASTDAGLRWLAYVPLVARICAWFCVCAALLPCVLVCTRMYPHVPRMYRVCTAYVPRMYRVCTRMYRLCARTLPAPPRPANYESAVCCVCTAYVPVCNPYVKSYLCKPTQTDVGTFTCT